MSQTDNETILPKSSAVINHQTDNYIHITSCYLKQKKRGKQKQSCSKSIISGLSTCTQSTVIGNSDRSRAIVPECTTLYNTYLLPTIGNLVAGYTYIQLPLYYNYSSNQIQSTKTFLNTKCLMQLLTRNRTCFN